MRVVLRLDGTSTSLIMHNERLSDPLDSFARGVAEVASKRKKTDSDHLELGHREFLGGLYTNGNGPCLPAWNIIRCLQEGGKRHKRGKHVLQGVSPLAEHADVLYTGPRDPAELWAEREAFSLRKGVGVGGRKVMRTRPIFQGWAAELPIEVDPAVFDLDDLQAIWTDAGKYIGMGDMRPIYGRFVGSVLSEKEWQKQDDGNTGSIWADNRANVERILAEDTQRQVVHA